MLTLSYGFKKPETGDLGSVWFPAMETNMQSLNDHTHNGVNSSALTPTSLSKFTSSILAADWISDGGGNYHVLVTVPSGISSASSPFNDVSYYQIAFLVSTSGATQGDRLGLGMERESSTTFTVRTNDNTLDVTVLYS